MDKPRVKFGGQTEEEAGANLALADLIHERRDAPWLNMWERGFLADIEKMLRSFGGYVTLTDKQFDRVFLIFEALDAMALSPTRNGPGPYVAES